MMIRVTLALAFVVLAGCGGGGSDKNCTTFLFIIVCDAPAKNTGSAPPPPPPPPAPAPEGSGNNGGGGLTVAMNRSVEFEPNSTLDNANVLSFLARGTMDVVGLEVTGTVSDADDAADFFIFTPQRNDRFGIYLCADTCRDFVVDDAVTIAVYDQNQTTIASTSMGAVEEQQLAVELSAGLAYYASVHAVDTGAVPYDYRLVIIE